VRPFARDVLRNTDGGESQCSLAGGVLAPYSSIITSFLLKLPRNAETDEGVYTALDLRGRKGYLLLSQTVLLLGFPQLITTRVPDSPGG